jgi:hypothetical protein
MVKKYKFVLILFLFLIVIILIESQTKVFHRIYDNILYDNQNHFLPCSKLPTEEYVYKVISAHQDAMDAILAVDTGNVGYDVDTTTCPGKADLIIWYASHQDRLEIQKIIIGSDFYGIPLRLQNR